MSTVVYVEPASSDHASFAARSRMHSSACALPWRGATRRLATSMTPMASESVSMVECWIRRVASTAASDSDGAAAPSAR